MPSFSFRPRQHLKALQNRTVSYDRPNLHAMDIASLSTSALLEPHDDEPSAVSSRLRFELKRRLHQGSI